MKQYQISGKQLVGLALLTAFFAATVVAVYVKIGPSLMNRWAGAKENEKVEEVTVTQITDPSVATDEKNNSEIYKAMSPGVVNITSTDLVRGDWFSPYPQEQQGSGSGSILDKEGHIFNELSRRPRTK